MILDQFRLDGKVVIVTGGTTGLGQGISIALSEAGADIACIDVSDQFAETRTAVEANDRRFIGVTADLCKMENIQPAVARVRDELGRIDILFNNAGIIRRSPCLEFFGEGLGRRAAVEPQIATARYTRWTAAGWRGNLG